MAGSGGGSRGLGEAASWAITVSSLIGIILVVIAYSLATIAHPLLAITDKVQVLVVAPGGEVSLVTAPVVEASEGGLVVRAPRAEPGSLIVGLEVEGGSLRVYSGYAPNLPLTRLVPLPASLSYSGELRLGWGEGCRAVVEEVRSGNSAAELLLAALYTGPGDRGYLRVAPSGEPVLAVTPALIVEGAGILWLQAREEELEVTVLEGVGGSRVYVPGRLVTATASLKSECGSAKVTLVAFEPGGGAALGELRSLEEVSASESTIAPVSSPLCEAYLPEAGEAYFRESYEGVEAMFGVLVEGVITVLDVKLEGVAIEVEVYAENEGSRSLCNIGGPGLPFIASQRVRG